jgi:hypothetical protein
MTTRALLVGCGLMMTSLTPAFADNFTATVVSYDPVLRTITFDDQSQLASIPATVAVPEIKKGDVVTVDFEASENGYESVNAITVKNRAISRRLLPLREKKG